MDPTVSPKDADFRPTLETSLIGEWPTKPNFKRVFKWISCLPSVKRNGIYIIVENKKIPYGTQGNCIEYYYNLTTKESGFTEKISVE